MLLPHLPPTFWNALPFRLLLRTSPLVLEAVTRANEHPDSEGLLGRPVNPGWLSRGYVLKDETGWSEGKILIPVSGVRADGMLYARGGRTDEGPWVFSELRLVRDDGRTVDLLGPIPQPSLVPLKNDVKIFIVPFGQVQGLGLETLPEFYRERSRAFRPGGRAGSLGAADVQSRARATHLGRIDSTHAAALAASST